MLLWAFRSKALMCQSIASWAASMAVDLLDLFPLYLIRSFVIAQRQPAFLSLIKVILILLSVIFYLFIFLPLFLSECWYSLGRRWISSISCCFKCCMICSGALLTFDLCCIALICVVTGPLISNEAAPESSQEGVKKRSQGCCKCNTRS